MASSPPEHHVDRLGHRLGDCSCNSALATEERLEKSTPKWPEGIFVCTRILQAAAEDGRV